jgi:regulator of protease activity HflC (stomatin/prohibitin superfamily)
MFDGIVRGITQFFQLFVFWFVVEPWQQCLRVRFGKHLKKIPPGFHIKIPYFDSLHVQASRYRTAQCAPQTLTTADGKTVVCTFAVGYALADIEKFYQSVHDANSTLTQIVSGFVADEIAITDSKNISAIDISERLTNNLSQRFVKYGLKDVSVRLQDFAFIRAIRLINDGRWNNDLGLSTEFSRGPR